MRYFTLLQLNKSIQRLFRQIEGSFWVAAEVTSVAWTSHIFLELAQREGELIVAKNRATLWADRLQWLKEKLGEDPALLLREGNKLLLKVSVRYHEVYGLTLEVEDIDLRFTLGELALKKQKTLLKLEENGLLDLQRQLPLPLVPQRIAVISSKTAAGWEDFSHQLMGNSYGYSFQVTLFPAGVQGDKALPELLTSLRSIPSDRFDVLVIIRGGGSRLDLEVFNAYELAAELATFPLPVLTGLGHQRDRSVTDEVAARPFKTPTAVAEYLVQKLMNFEGALLEKQQDLSPLVHHYLLRKKQALQFLQNELAFHCKRMLDRELQKLDWLGQDLKKNTFAFLKYQSKEVAAMRHYFEAISPAQMLRKGYAIVHYLDVDRNFAKKDDKLLVETVQQKITARVVAVESR